MKIRYSEPRHFRHCPFFHFDLGMKIPNGIGVLGKSFNSTKPHVNPYGIGPTKTLFFTPGYLHYLLRCCKYCSSIIILIWA
jgi:hypothetical protein